MFVGDQAVKQERDQTNPQGATSTDWPDQSTGGCGTGRNKVTYKVSKVSYSHGGQCTKVSHINLGIGVFSNHQSPKPMYTWKNPLFGNYVEKEGLAEGFNLKYVATIFLGGLIIK